MNHSAILEGLQKNKLFKEFSFEEISALIPFVKIEEFPKEAWIVQEGDEGDEVYFICSGSAEILKFNEKEKEFFQLAELKEDDFVGEMAFFEDLKRSASVRVIEPVKAIVLNLKKLKETVNQQEIYSKLVLTIAKKMSERLRVSDRRIISFLKEKIALAKIQDHVGKTIIYILITMTLILNISIAYSGYSVKLSTVSTAYYPLVVLLLAVSSLWMIIHSGYPLAFYGLTLHNWKKHSLQAVIFTTPILVFLVILKWALITSLPSLSGLAIFSFKPASQSISEFFIYSIVFVLFVPFQELMVRGFLQSSFYHFFQGIHRSFLAILASNLLYEIFSTVANFWYAICLFAIGVFWGYLYEEQKSIVGCVISHILIGYFALFILDFDSVIALSHL